MADEPTFDDVKGESDPVGDTTTRTVQQLGRVDVPDDYLEQIGADKGDKIFVACEEDEVRITKASADRIFDDA